MATKIFSFPVRGQRWCFSAIVPDVPAGKYSSVVTLSQLWERLQSLPQFTDRAELMESFASTKMQTKWSDLGAQPSGSIRHKVFSVGQNLLNRLPAEEQFLKKVPKDTPKVELIFPSSLNPRLVRRRLRHLAHYGTVYHRRLMYGSISLLPFTVLLGILPIPNVVFFWNIFRAHSHWSALQSSTRLKLLLTEGEDEALTSETKGASKNSSSTQKPSWVFKPSRELDSMVKPADVSAGVMQPSTVSAISKTFGLNSEEVLRWIASKK
ncbi:hypothetical protein M758_1G046100 [Ceratodon purpureus]|uniref:Uncharacterized protein n=1 Tax=Ceratodon purpureus TaxID=3225 RepID=A0A8T0J3X2_CERPU|nr:hypothetical protein KC19_1G048700 [Ceratodon purpureus]KAG0628703.1 hypothetical protein M758_1G046100 [Ceratodon purpureus]